MGVVEGHKFVRLKIALHQRIVGRESVAEAFLRGGVNGC